MVLVEGSRCYTSGRGAQGNDLQGLHAKHFIRYTAYKLYGRGSNVVIIHQDVASELRRSRNAEFSVKVNSYTI